MGQKPRPTAGEDDITAVQCRFCLNAEDRCRCEDVGEIP
jgi:hypothetical protein